MPNSLLVMQEKRFLLITFTVVALVGGPTVFSIIRDPQVKTSVSSVGGNRSPASVSEDVTHDEDFQVRNPVQAKSISLQLPCDNLSSSHEIDGSLLRLTGSCQDGAWKGLNVTKVINKTNGFTADVIIVPAKGFTTDFIDLAAGENVIEITVKDEKGAETQANLHVNRKPASLSEGL